jgi:hypothetical protein
MSVHYDDTMSVHYDDTMSVHYDDTMSVHYDDTMSVHYAAIAAMAPCGSSGRSDHELCCCCCPPAVYMIYCLILLVELAPKHRLALGLAAFSAGGCK